MNGSFEGEVIRVMTALAPGDVASYGEIAQEAGFPGAARAVGNVLARTEGLPWWRVIRSDGSLASKKVVEQAHLLEAEGVQVVGGRVHPRELHARWPVEPDKFETNPIGS